MPVNWRPSSGTWFHSLQATSHALQPMQTDVSVKNPIRGGAPRWPLLAAGAPSSSSRPRMSTATAHLPTSVPVYAGPADVLVHQGGPVGAPRPAAGTDVAGERLHLLDVHVRVERQRGQLVRRVPSRVAVGPPVVGESDLVD